MLRHIHAHLIQKAQRPHWHSKIEHRFVDVLDRRPRFEQVPRLDQIGHQDAVDQETRTVLDDNRQFADLLHETQRALDHIRPAPAPDDHLDQLHPVHRIEEMDADDSFRRFRGVRQFRNGKGRGVGRQNAVRSR